MKKLILSLSVASLAVLMLVGAALAAGPHSGSTGDQIRDRDRDRDRVEIPAILGLTEAEVMTLRQGGLSLAQIAERQKVDPQKLVDALAARWTERIEARLANGAISAERATELKSQVTLQARNMVYKTTLGGMQGGAVGAGPRAGSMDGTGPIDGTGSRAANGYGAGNGSRAGNGDGAGTGTCDGSGRN